MTFDFEDRYYTTTEIKRKFCIKDKTWRIWMYGDKKRRRNNVVPLPIKPGTEADWMKTANRSELLDLLMKYGGFGEKYLKDLSDDELKELIDYSIQTGGMG